MARNKAPGRRRKQLPREKVNPGRPRLPSEFFAYYRISTNGNCSKHLLTQQQTIATYLKHSNARIIRAFSETEPLLQGERPELKKALWAARKRRLPVVVAKVGRLKHSPRFLLQLIEADVEVHCADVGTVGRNWRVTLQQLLVSAESQAKLTSKRVRVGLAAAVARGKKLGGNRGSKLLAVAAAAGGAAVAARAHARATEIWPTIADIQSDGVTSLRGIANALNERGIPTARGREWSAVQVTRVVRRLSSRQPDAYAPSRSSPGR